MRVFVTGATGFVGSAIVEELAREGHQVLGLTRSDAGAESIAAAGAKVRRGDLEDLDSLRSGAAAADGVIHTAFNLDISKWAESSEIERRAIEALGAVLEGSGRPLLVTSGFMGWALGRVVTEDDARPLVTPAPRAAEALATSLAGRGVRTSVIRLAGVYGRGDRIIVPTLIHIAREKGVSAYVGEGLNRLPTVHRLDAALLYRLALEKGSAGARYHAVAEEGIRFRDIAEVIGRRLNVPVVSKSSEEAADHFGGWPAMLAGGDWPASSKLTRERLGWRPVQHSFLTELERESDSKS